MSNDERLAELLGIDLNERDYAEMTQGAFMREFRQVLDARDLVTALQKRVNGLRASLEREAIRRAEAEETEKFTADGLTISVKERPVANVGAESDWNEILSKLCEDGYGHLVQRRISAQRLQEEMDGGYRLPEGLRIEQIRQVSHRRNS